MVKLTRNNRDSLVDQVYAQLRESLELGPPGTGKPRMRGKRKKASELHMPPWRSGGREEGARADGQGGARASGAV